jgi:HSP20 family protein
MGLLARRDNKELFSPWEDLTRFSRQMDRWLSGMRVGLPADGTAFMLASVDVEDKGDHYDVKADLPGLDKKDLKISLVGNDLTIEGKREEKSEEKKRNYFRSERFSGSFQRVIELPGALKADKAKARYENGVLTLEIPKEAASAGPVTNQIPVQ